MKSLTEQLPQIDLLMICELIAAETSADHICIWHQEGISTQNGSGADFPKSPLIAAYPTGSNFNLEDVGDLRSLAFGSTDQLVIEAMSQGVAGTDLDGSPKEPIVSYILQPVTLRLPAGFFYNTEGPAQSEAGAGDHRVLPALHTLEIAAVLAVLDRRPREYEQRTLDAVQRLAKLLERLVDHWTSIQQEQQRRRKLRHDLRTPLTSMTMLPDLIMLSPDFDPELGNMCTQLKTAAMKMDQLLAADDHS